MRVSIRRGVRFTVALVAALSFALSVSLVRGADTRPVAGAPRTLQVDGTRAAAPPADVTVFNRRIVTLRATFHGATPEDRAGRAEERIAELLARPGEAQIGVDPFAEGMIVLINGSLAFPLFPDDADAASGETLGTVAESARAALVRVAAETRESRDIRSLVRAATYAGIATAVLVGLLWVLALARRAVTRRLQRFAASHELRVGGAELVRRDHAARWARGLTSALYWLIVLLLVYEWLGVLLKAFPFTRAWGERLDEWLFGVAGKVLVAIVHALPNLAVAVLIFLIARIVAKLLNEFFDRVQGGRAGTGLLDADLARPTRRIASVVVWLFALAMAYPYLPGSQTEAFRGISVLIGLMVSLGGSSIVAQGASGLILMFTRTLRPGEYVRIAEHEGTVVDLGTFMTRIRTGLGEELTLPNALILGSVTRNYSRVVKTPGFVLDTAVTIGYDAPWRQVHAMLIEAARRTPGVLAEPQPHVFQTALSDFFVEYRLVCQAVPTEPRPRAEALSILHQNVQDVFNEHGVQILSPHYFGDPREPKIVPPAQWYAPPAERPDRPAGAAPESTS